MSLTVSPLTSTFADKGAQRIRDTSYVAAGYIRAMSDAATTSSLTQQMLEWIAERPRTYVETIEAWKTSCPRLTIWEDAVDDGLVRVERGSVTVTQAGRQKVASRNPEMIASATSAATIRR
jgi:hypothetical protein